jgi:hypothetical protein
MNKPTETDRDIAWAEELIRGMPQGGVWRLSEPIFIDYGFDHANKTVHLLTPLVNGFSRAFHENIKRAFPKVGWNVVCSHR